MVGHGSGPSMGRVGLGWVGSGRVAFGQNSLSWAGRVGSGPVSKICNKYTVY